MPIYEYQCKTCESKFEVLQSINADNSELACPDCGAEKPMKVFSSFASIGNGKAAAPMESGFKATCDTGST